MQKITFDHLIKIGMAVFFFHIGIANAEIHGTITGTTDYIYRMYSKSNSKPAIQGNLDYQHSSGFYTGVSVSNFDIGPSEVAEDTLFLDSAQVEIVPYAGWSFKLPYDFRFDFQYSRYFFDGEIYSKPGEYNEFYAFIHYKDLLTVQVSGSDDFYGIGGPAYFYEITGRYPITDYLEVSAGFGYSQAKQVLLADYKYWNAGVTGRYKFVALDLRYYDAREVAFGDDIDQALLPDHPETLKATVVFSISLGF
jgi:uncharacterized protein (TIGR02001 family)